MTSHTDCLLAASTSRPWGMVAVAYRWITEPYERAQYTVRKLRFRRIQICNNLTHDILTQIRPLAHNAPWQACRVTVRWQIGGGVLYLYDTLWKAQLTLVQQRSIDRAKHYQGLNGTQPHSMHPYGCKSDVSQRDSCLSARRGVGQV